MLRSILVLLSLLLLAACRGDSEPTPAPTQALPTSGAEAGAGEGATPSPDPTAEATLTEPTEAVVEATATEPTEPAVEATATEPAATAEPSPTATTPPEVVQPFDPAGVTLSLEPVVRGLNQPLALATVDDGSGRFFIAEKGGLVKVVQDGAVLPDPVLDIRNRVSSGYEQGLLGLAFEPGRPERFYINYTDRNGTTVIARYRMGENPNIADPASEEILLTLEQPAANHNGGHLLFGPDGYLWIGMGDGGAAGDRFQNGQNPGTLLGAMLRLDVSGESGYSIPPDNPFAGGDGGAPEIWAIGLRNPWRYSFDRATGELWVADVGQAQWEEVNRVPSDQPALNFGWPILESNSCYQRADCSREGLVLPITAYTHEFGCSITGGNVYRGQAFPELQGGYFFADFCTGLLWAIPADSETAVEPTLLLETGLPISSFGEDQAGELYLTAFDGVLYRLVGEGR